MTQCVPINIETSSSPRQFGTIAMCFCGFWPKKKEKTKTKNKQINPFFSWPRISNFVDLIVWQNVNEIDLFGIVRPVYIITSITVTKITCNNVDSEWIKVALFLIFLDDLFLFAWSANTNQQQNNNTIKIVWISMECQMPHAKCVRNDKPFDDFTNFHCSEWKESFKLITTYCILEYCRI